MKKNGLVKLLAMVMTLSIIFAGCVSAFAEDTTEIGEELEYIIVVADGDQRYYISSEGDEQFETKDLKTENIVGPAGRGEAPVIIDVTDEQLSVETKEIVNNSENIQAVVIYTEGEESEVTFSSEDITSKGPGVLIFNNGGDVEATTGAITAVGGGVHIGMIFTPEEEITGSNTFTMNGDMEISSKKNGDSFGIENIEYNPDMKEKIVANGNIIVDSDGEAIGVGIKTQGDADLELNGDVTVNGGKFAMGVALDGVDPNYYSAYEIESGKITAKMTGNMEVTGESAQGYEAHVKNGGLVTLDMTGNTKVTGIAEETEEEAAIPFTTTTAFMANNEGGTIQATFTGNMISNDDGIVMTDNTDYTDKTDNVDKSSEHREQYEDAIAFNADEIYDAQANDNDYCLYRHEDGDTVVYYLANPETKQVAENSAYTKEFDEVDAGKTTVKVVGNVKADETGAWITLENKDSEMSLIVEKTLSGDAQSVLLSTDTISENLTLTVWEIKKNDAGNVVERVVGYDEDGEAITEADTEAEKNIQYIIKVEPSQKDIITTQGTTKYEGYDVAKEGETVTLKIDVPEGYQIKNAFSDSDQTIEMAQDADGNYYLIVEKGGAVMISVEFEKIPEPEPAPAPMVAETEIGNDQKASVFTLLSITDKTEEVDIIFYSNGTYKAVFSDGTSENGTFKLDNDQIVLVNAAGTDMPIMKDGDSWKLLYAAGTTQYEFKIADAGVQKLIEALK